MQREIHEGHLQAPALRAQHREGGEETLSLCYRIGAACGQIAERYVEVGQDVVDFFQVFSNQLSVQLIVNH